MEVFLSMMLNKRFLPYITLPSRITETTATCIDHIFIRYPFNKNKYYPFSTTDSGLLFCDISDHLPCFVNLRTKIKQKSYSRPKVRLFGSQNSSNFKNLMTNFNWNTLNENSTNWYQDFLVQIKKKIDSAFPLVTLSRKRAHDKPWITTGLKSSISKNHKLYKKTNAQFFRV